MRVKTLASTIFVAILFLIACNRNAVSLSYTNAKEEVHVVLFEPGTTLNTGNVKNEMTLEKLGRV